MTEPALTRPQRVTMACLFMGLTCVILLITIGSMLSNWGSIEVQAQVRKLLAEEPFKGSGLTVTAAMGWLRWALLGAAAVVSAGVVFAVYTARGHQASRIILTVMCGLSALVFLAGGLFGILPAAFSIGCGLYLWTADSRRWFAIKNGKVPAPLPVAVVPVAVPVPANPVAAAGSSAEPVPGQPRPAARSPRPQAVYGAGLTALIASALVALVCGVNALGYLLARSEYLRALNDQALMRDLIDQSGLSSAEFARAMFIGCSVAAALSLLAMLAAVGTLLGRSTARAALQILAVITLPISVITFPVGLLWTAAAVAVLILLRRPESRHWMR